MFVLAGCQAPILKSTPQIEIEHIPFAASSRKFNPLGEIETEEELFSTGRIKKHTIKDFKLSFTQPILWWRPNFDESFYIKETLPFYYLSGNSVYAYDIGYRSWQNEKDFRRDYLSGNDLSKYIGREKITYHPYHKPMDVKEFFAENPDIEPQSMLENEEKGPLRYMNREGFSDDFVVGRRGEVFSQEYIILKEGKNYYYTQTAIEAGWDSFFENEQFFLEE